MRRSSQVSSTLHSRIHSRTLLTDYYVLASSLNGWDHNIGTVTVHSFNENTVDEGEPRMGAGYNDKLRPVGSETVYGSSNPWEDEEEEDESEEDDEDE